MLKEIKLQEKMVSLKSSTKPFSKLLSLNETQVYLLKPRRESASKRKNHCVASKSNLIAILLTSLKNVWYLISTLSATKQIFETSICAKLVNHLKKFQFGFRKRHSTAQARVVIAVNLTETYRTYVHIWGFLILFLGLWYCQS